MRETLGFHPLANLFPLIEGQAFVDLTEDIRVKGVRRKIILFEGLILDGRNRYRAAEAADVDHVPYEVFTGSYREALDLVISENLHRRHLTDNQRQYVAAKIANLTPGRPAEETPPIGGISVADAAKLLNVSARSVERAKQVQRDASPELAAAVERGLVAVDMAARASKMDLTVQAQVVNEAESGKLKTLKAILKRAERTAKEQQLGDKQRALPTKKYGVIYADPEWEFVVYSRDTGLDRSPDNHYPTSTEQVIASRDVASIAADDCVLFLWTTDLARGVRVMEAWGFTFKSYRVWVKDIVEWHPTPEQEKTGIGGKGRLFIEIGAAGTGFWNRDRDELVLIGTRGNVPAPSMGTQGESVLFAARPHIEGTERDRHSAKPPEMAEWIEEHFPNLPKIELNARTARRGWDLWGNEAPETTHDPETGEVHDDLPPPRPERSRLLPDKDRIAALTDANGMVQIDETHVVAAAFVTAGEIAQAEAFAAHKATADETCETALTPEEELAYQDWKAEFAPNDSGDDYDLRGAFKAGVTADETFHWPDTFKKPNHPTFSVDSIYAERAPKRAGRGDGDRFVPPGEVEKSLGLWVGKTFRKTTVSATPAEQYVEQPATPAPRPRPAPADEIEIPDFLRRIPKKEASD